MIDGSVSLLCPLTTNFLRFWGKMAMFFSFPTRYNYTLYFVVDVYSHSVCVCVCVCVSSPQTKQWVADMKMNGEVRGVAFTPDAKNLLSYGSRLITMYMYVY